MRRPQLRLVLPALRGSGGEKVFVDYAGDTLYVIDSEMGAARPIKLFVAAVGPPAASTPRRGRARAWRLGWTATSGPSPSSATIVCDNRRPLRAADQPHLQRRIAELTAYALSNFERLIFIATDQKQSGNLRSVH
jgi:hypothetical protein